MNVVNRLRTPLARLLAFVLGAAGSLAFAVFAAGSALGMIGPVRSMVAMAFVSAVASAVLLTVTLGLLRGEGLGISALGLPLSGRRAREFALGFVVSAALFIAVAWTQSAMVGASWAFQGAPGALAALWGLPLAASMVMAEELLFRGAALRTGSRPASQSSVRHPAIQLRRSFTRCGAFRSAPVMHSGCRRRMFFPVCHMSSRLRWPQS